MFRFITIFWSYTDCGFMHFRLLSSWTWRTNLGPTPKVGFALGVQLIWPSKNRRPSERGRGERKRNPNKSHRRPRVSRRSHCQLKIRQTNYYSPVHSNCWPRDSLQHCSKHFSALQNNAAYGCWLFMKSNAFFDVHFSYTKFKKNIAHKEQTALFSMKNKHYFAALNS